jgi:hypothetical protein
MTGAGRAVVATLPYAAPMRVRPRYHANDASRDVLDLAPRTVTIADARAGNPPPALEPQGFELCEHRSSIRDFADARAVAKRYSPEIRQLLLEVSGADAVAVNPHGILRFSERSAQSGRLDNSRPARFVHVDVSDATAAMFAARSNPTPLRRVRRYCHYNVWRVWSAPPQDVPLAVCDAGTVKPADLVAADAIFDAPGVPEWSFEGLVVKGSPMHRWVWFPDMDRDQVLVFKTNDSDPTRAHCVPHVAFDDPSCPAGVPPRTSIEMRGIAYWYRDDDADQ